MPTSHWSLDDLAYHILQEAHYRDMSRSTIQRILAEADLQPHKSRYWLKSKDSDYEAKTLALCDLYLKALALYARVSWWCRWTRRPASRRWSGCTPR